MKNTTIVSNSFTNYRAEIKHNGDHPSASTLLKHMRRAKGRECKSETKIWGPFSRLRVTKEWKGEYKVVSLDY